MSIKIKIKGLNSKASDPSMSEWVFPHRGLAKIVWQAIPKTHKQESKGNFLGSRFTVRYVSDEALKQLSLIIHCLELKYDEDYKKKMARHQKEHLIKLGIPL